VQTRTIPLSLPKFRDFIEMLSDLPQYRTLASNPRFLRYLVRFGAVPRSVVEFANLALRCPASDFKAAFNVVWEDYVLSTWRQLASGSLLRVVAYALSGRRVSVDDLLTVKMKSSDEERQLTWQQLADIGMVLLQRVDLTSTVVVQVPYCAMRICADIGAADTSAEANLPEICLVAVLKWLRDMVDEAEEQIEPWEAWERFGAAFHALRVNSFLVIGVKSVTLDCLLPGAEPRPLCLHPMKVAQATEALNPTHVLTNITCKHTNKRHQWILDNDGISWVVQNGSSGKGADIFFPLDAGTPESSLHSWFLVVDQRKREALISFATAAIQGYVQKAHSVCPSKEVAAEMGLTGEPIIAIFSLLASTSPKANIPDNSVVISYTDHDAYHGTLSGHPAACAGIDINYGNKSSLQLLFKADVVEVLLEARSEQLFSPETFSDFLEKNGVQLSEQQKCRIVLLPPPSPN
jgi:hypothetical protein